MRAMIIQPMNGKTDQEIREEREKAVALLESYGYDVENTLFDMDDDWLRSTGYKHIPLVYLAESLKVMSRCDAVYLCEGWQNARGCLLEYAAAVQYGLRIVCLPEATEDFREKENMLIASEIRKTVERLKKGVNGR